jgi:hypothetical protein
MYRSARAGRALAEAPRGVTPWNKLAGSNLGCEAAPAALLSGQVHGVLGCCAASRAARQEPLSKSCAGCCAGCEAPVIGSAAQWAHYLRTPFTPTTHASCFA